MANIFLKIFLVIAAYLIGAINMATIVGKIKGKNVKKLGSGNPGTMNVMRSIGKGWGALTFAFDCAKGAVFSLIGRFAVDGGSTEWMLILGAVTVIGHIFPVYTKFKGGKGVATSLGMFMVATPIVGPCVFLALILYLLVCKIGFIGSYLAVTALTVVNCVKYRSSIASIVLLLVVWALVIYRHKDNVKRFIRGKENTLSIVGKNEVKPLGDEQENAQEKSDDEARND
ncbi:MAG: glycerol-3-phosphate acyltransferase [Clostridia bacterium]|nr:glycerol-3-phosphate acyltransferase [Clostridia bacterium]MDE7328556.1 glycerol-3-phosphate acyltransferase [Clostridia bacterium]